MVQSEIMLEIGQEEASLDATDWRTARVSYHEARPTRTHRVSKKDLAMASIQDDDRPYAQHDGHGDAKRVALVA